MTRYRKIILGAFALSAALLSIAPNSRASEALVVPPQGAAEKAVMPSTPFIPEPLAATITPPAATAIPSKEAFRVGYVDLSRVAEESVVGKATKARFKERSSKVQAQIAAKQKQLEKQKSALEAKMPTLIPDQRRVKISEYEKKVEEFRAYLKNAEKEMQPFQEELTLAMTKETVAACDSFGRDHGLMAISVRKDFLYLGQGVETTDITSDIITLMDAQKKPM